MNDINRILYSAIYPAEEPKNTLPPDREILEYLITLYRAGYDGRRFAADLEGLSAKWAEVGNPCSFRGLALSHYSFRERKANEARMSNETRRDRWLVAMEKIEEIEETEDTDCDE